MLDAGTTTGRLYYSSPQRLADIVTRRRALTRSIYTGRIRRTGSPVDEPVAVRPRPSGRTVPPEFARQSAHTGQAQLLPMPGRSCGTWWIGLYSRPRPPDASGRPVRTFPVTASVDELTRAALSYCSWRAQSSRSDLSVPSFHLHLCPSKSVSLIGPIMNFGRDMDCMSRNSKVSTSGRSLPFIRGHPGGEAAGDS